MFVERFPVLYTLVPADSLFPLTQILLSLLSGRWHGPSGLLPHEREVVLSFPSALWVFLASPEAAPFATGLGIAELSWALPPFAQSPGPRHCTTSV